MMRAGADRSMDMIEPDRECIDDLRVDEAAGGCRLGVQVRYDLSYRTPLSLSNGHTSHRADVLPQAMKEIAPR